MKDKILSIISERIEYYKVRVSPTKRVKKSISIFSEDISPKNLLQFMKDNDIPEDAEFDTSSNYYDGFDDFLLSWYTEESKTEQDIEDDIKRRININVFKQIAEAYLENGYVRVGVDYEVYKKYKDTTVYDMYVNGEYENLVEYFNMYFKINK